MTFNKLIDIWATSTRFTQGKMIHARWIICENNEITVILGFNPMYIYRMNWVHISSHVIANSSRILEYYK
jgi:hypothetical protein